MLAGVSGLRNHQLRMDVISNNIANVNTTGYKAARSSFAEMFSQRLSDASSANAAGTLGGINPKQVGLGAVSSSIDVIHTAGAFQGTDRALDLVIIDEGFFAVSDGEDVFYTRSGNLYIDSFGYLITAGGQYVMGRMLIDSDEFEKEGFMEEAAMEHIQNNSDRIAWGEPKDSDDNVFLEFLESEDFMEDSIVRARYADSEDNRTAIFGEPGEAGLIGRLVIPTYYRQISIDESGVIKGIDEEGNAIEIGVIASATFQNPGGLTKVGDNLFRESSNSGSPAICFPGLGPSGGLKAGGLEMSNVDLANEFTSMIVTQRGYQANSRIITVSDTLLEELVNLKR
jgi:flagellar hook protein FlgE